MGSIEGAGAGAAEGSPILVCGLGALGQRCVEVLRSYDVPVRTLDIRDQVELGREGGVASPFVRGDCRSTQALQAAGIEECRAVMLVTGDPHANIEGALAARKAKAQIRIVSRAGDHHLMELLSSALGNCVAYDPNRLAAGALALAALGAEIVGHFHLEGRLLRVIRHRVVAGDPWVGASAEEANAHGVMVLEHLPREQAEATRASHGHGDLFHQHDPARVLAVGDVLTLLAIDRAFEAEAREAKAPVEVLREGVVSRLAKARRSIGRTTGVVLGAATAVLVAVSLAAFLFPLGDPSLTHRDAIFSALVLMTGGTYADLFPAFHFLPDSLRTFSVTLSVIGTVATGLLYAWLTDRLMTIRLRLGPRRPPPPRAGHVVVVGLGRVGRSASSLLRDLGRPVLAVESRTIEPHALPHLAVLSGDGAERETLEAAGIPGARGVLAVTDSDWVNLEIALRARTLNPDCQLVMRTRDPRFSENVAGAFQGVRVLCVPVIAAKAFAAAALGEDVLDLFQLHDRTVFVIEFQVEAGDGLDGRLLPDVAEGYSVIPVLLQAPGHEARFCSPLDRAVRLAPGDRLVLLGPSRSLQKIERGDLNARREEVTLTGLRPYADRIALAGVLVKQLGYPLERAQGVFEGLPASLEERLYPHQAHRLRTALEAGGVVVEKGPG
ncbi:MAG TPA: NAD-binding protein [Polyangiaceae bacterium]|jgi:Trk K+ transport system NAD-binding subunit